MAGSGIESGIRVNCKIGGDVLPNRQDLPDNTIDIQRQEDEITNTGRDKCFEVKKTAATAG